VDNTKVPPLPTPGTNGNAVKGAANAAAAGATTSSVPSSTASTVVPAAESPEEIS